MALYSRHREATGDVQDIKKSIWGTMIVLLAATRERALKRIAGC